MTAAANAARGGRAPARRLTPRASLAAIFALSLLFWLAIAGAALLLAGA